MSLRNIKAFNHIFDIVVQRQKDKLQVSVQDINGHQKKILVKKGATINIDLATL